MPAIIGGSASTGSSLLNNILNRHSLIYAGPETHLLTKPRLYQDWGTYKDTILTKKGDAMKSPGIHRFNGVILDGQKPVGELLATAKDLSQFASNYFSFFGKQYWVEKTPANSYCFDLFLNEFEEAKCILMVRNPYDAIASMMARGLSVFKAASIYLANTLANLDLRKNVNFQIVKYESLVTSPANIVSGLCMFLGIDYESQMMDAEDELIKMDGWKQNEKGALGKGSIGRFFELTGAQQDEIISVVDLIKLKSNNWPFTSVLLKDISDICALFDYEYIQPEKVSASSKSNLWKEELESTIKRYPTNIFNYPIAFK